MLYHTNVNIGYIILIKYDINDILIWIMDFYFLLSINTFGVNVNIY